MRRNKHEPRRFPDRDGVLIEDKSYLHRAEEIVFVPGAAAALKRLADAGFKLFIVSNQSGVGRGYFTLSDVEQVNSHLAREFARHGVTLQKIYVAPEGPDQPSRGRKPSAEFLFDARNEFALDPAQSYMIGDKMSDLECGWNAGVKGCILVRTGYGAKVERESGGQLTRAVFVNDLPAAADWILQNIEPSKR
jgi:D,D-heptose 1,7-bisphosphate phosphatase